MARSTARRSHHHQPATTLQAIAYETGLTTSGVASGSYTINPGSTITQIDCGGWVDSPFTPDTDYTGGSTSGTDGCPSR